MKVKYTRTETFVFDTEKLSDFFELTNEDFNNLPLCKIHCDLLIPSDFTEDIGAERKRETKLEKI